MKFPIRRLYLKIRYRLRLSPITRRRLSRWLKYQELFFTVCSLLIYGMLIFEQLTVFPCYFFCDEAINGVEAYSLLTGTQYSQRIGILWPKFFQGFGDYDLSLSVYLDVPFVKLFGLNEFAVRLAIAVNSLIGVGAVYILVRFIFKLPLACRMAVSPA